MSFLQSPIRRVFPFLTLMAVLFAFGGTWQFGAPAVAQTKILRGNAAATSVATAKADPAASSTDDDGPANTSKRSGKQLAGKLNLNTANAEQLMLLPSVGPAKAERIMDWRTKNGQFRRVADLRKVKGFGYKTLKKLEPYLDVKGDTTLIAR